MNEGIGWREGMDMVKSFLRRMSGGPKKEILTVFILNMKCSIGAGGRILPIMSLIRGSVGY
ncbi:hypothetical protein [Paenibacillus ihumii]|uniref:hypothetical protein n=1 Tax=Paenibacillus ihumii TaxID=687436 RepID=UPI000A9386E4|nr:hypothetical protein [Paenibacillus ihumii]